MNSHSVLKGREKVLKKVRIFLSLLYDIDLKWKQIHTDKHLFTSFSVADHGTILILFSAPYFMSLASAHLVLDYVYFWEGDEVLEFFHARFMTGHSSLCLLLYYLHNSKWYCFLNKAHTALCEVLYFPLVNTVNRKVFSGKGKNANYKSFYKLNSGTMADIWLFFC